MFIRINTFSKLLTAFVLVVAMSCSDEIPEPTGSNTKQENENDGGNGNSGNGSGGSGGSGNGGGSNSSTSWIVDTEFVVNGGVGKDGIPALLNPTMIGPNDDGLEYLQDDERVIGVKIGEDIQAFPHPILDYHEIINTEVGGDEIAISYCPLTGTSKAWSRTVNGVSTTFGVSGLLYQSNLILYDRLTQSNWSQILDLSVNGETVGVESDQYEVFETSWGTWKNMYPNTKVTSSDTKWDRDYNKYPYLDYDEEDWLMFPISTDDDRLFRKERVLSVMIDGLARVYTFKEFIRGGVINDEFRNTELIIVGDNSRDFMVAFEVPSFNGEKPDFELLKDSGANILRDQFNNVYDIFGNCVEGPNTGFKLDKPESLIGYWFAIAAFYPLPEIYSTERN